MKRDCFLKQLEKIKVLLSLGLQILPPKKGSRGFSVKIGVNRGRVCRDKHNDVQSPLLPITSFSKTPSKHTHPYLSSHTLFHFKQEILLEKCIIKGQVSKNHNILGSPWPGRQEGGCGPASPAACLPALLIPLVVVGIDDPCLFLCRS